MDELERLKMANEQATTKVIEQQLEYWSLAVKNTQEQNRILSMRAEAQPTVRRFGKSWIASYCDVLGVGDTPAKAVAAYHKVWHEGVSEPLPEDAQQ